MHSLQQSRHFSPTHAALQSCWRQPWGRLQHCNGPGCTTHYVRNCPPPPSSHLGKGATTNVAHHHCSCRPVAPRNITQWPLLTTKAGMHPPPPRPQLEAGPAAAAKAWWLLSQAHPPCRGLSRPATLKTWALETLADKMPRTFAASGMMRCSHPLSDVNTPSLMHLLQHFQQSSQTPAALHRAVTAGQPLGPHATGH